VDHRSIKLVAKKCNINYEDFEKLKLNEQLIIQEILLNTKYERAKEKHANDRPGEFLSPLIKKEKP
jgi:hypothetical protein